MTRLLGGLPFTLRPLADYPGAWLPDETETTYRGNALLKAYAAARLTGTWVIADDSGLEVDALGGAPGVYSARFGGPGLDDAGRTALLLERLRGVPMPHRTARFRAVLAIITPTGEERIVEGVADGLIADFPRGTRGFGYDPVFVYPQLGKTFAELTDDERARVSHRGLAVRAARALLA